MSTVLKLAGIAALAALVWMSCEWALAWRTVRHVTRELPALVGDEAELTRQAAVKEIQATRGAAVAAIDRLAGRAEKQLREMRIGTLEETARLRADLTTQSTLWRGEVSRQADAANGTLAGLRSDVRPVLDNAALLESDASRTVRLVTPQLVGAAAAWKVTGGNSAQIMRDLKPAAPAAAKAVQNVEKLTRPASWLVRAARIAAKVVWPF